MRRGLALAAAAAALAGCAEPPAAKVDRALAEGRRQEAFRIASELVQAAEARGKTDPEPWILLARTALLTRRTSLGVEAAARAVELAPGDARAHHVKAQLDQKRRRNIAAVEAAREATRLDPDEPRYQATLGEFLLGGGMVGTADYAGAEAAFRAALALDPRSARASAGLGKTLVLAGRDEEGAKELERALAANPFHGDAVYHRGLARLRQRDFAGAAEDFRRATILPPQPAHAFFNLARALQLTGATAEAEEMRRRYQTLHPLQNDIESLETSFHSHSDNLMVAYELVAALAEARRFDEAKFILESACEDGATLPRPHFALAEVALADGDAARAVAAAERAVERTSGGAAAHRLAAEAYALGGDDEAALRHARAAAAREPANPEVALLLGGLLVRAGSFAEAARILEDVRRAAPQDPRVVAALGRALTGAGRPQDGEALLSAALRARPRNQEWLTARAQARAAMGKNGWAEDDLREAVAVASSAAAPYDALSRLLRESGREDEAAELAKKAGEAERLEREEREARREFHSKPGDAGAAHRFAEVLRRLGRSAEADHVEGRAAAVREEL
jgi:tetratricopeptide (TPR) repeat protein